ASIAVHCAIEPLSDNGVYFYGRADCDTKHSY
ncbi:MAG: hypothetical protein ACI90G_000466, partial [Urechidicola sp.]